VVREVAVFDYRGAVPDTGASTVHRLGEMPVPARDALLAQLASQVESLSVVGPVHPVRAAAAVRARPLGA
jgi:hypothetical protein